MPKWASFLQQALDRCIGKPMQTIEVQHTREVTWESLALKIQENVEYRVQLRRLLDGLDRGLSAHEAASFPQLTEVSKAEVGDGAD